MLKQTFITNYTYQQPFSYSVLPYIMLYFIIYNYLTINILIEQNNIFPHTFRDQISFCVHDRLSYQSSHDGNAVSLTKRLLPESLALLLVAGFDLLITDRVLFVATLYCCSTWYCCDAGWAHWGCCGCAQDGWWSHFVFGFQSYVFSFWLHQ